MKSLSDGSTQNYYASQCWKLWGTWKDSDYIKRRVKFKKYVNTALESCELPVVGFKDGHTKGPLFEPRTWEILFPGDEIMKADISWESFSHMVGTFYHEARHSEQFYRIAQGVAAGKFVLPVLSVGKVTPEILSQYCYIDAETGAQAFLQRGKYPPEMHTCIRQWYISIYGRQRQHRVEVLRDRGEQAVAAYHEARPNANLAQYLRLPEERDAFEMQDAIQARLLNYRIQKEFAEAD